MVTFCYIEEEVVFFYKMSLTSRMKPLNLQIFNKSVYFPFQIFLLWEREGSFALKYFRLFAISFWQYFGLKKYFKKPSPLSNEISCTGHPIPLLSFKRLIITYFSFDTKVIICIYSCSVIKVIVIVSAKWWGILPNSNI